MSQMPPSAMQADNYNQDGNDDMDEQMRLALEMSKAQDDEDK